MNSQMRLEDLEFDNNTWRYAVAGLCAGASALIISGGPEYYNSETLKLSGLAMAGGASLVCSGTLFYRVCKVLPLLDQKREYKPPTRTSNWDP